MAQCEAPYWYTQKFCIVISPNSGNLITDIGFVKFDKCDHGDQRISLRGSKSASY